MAYALTDVFVTSIICYFVSSLLVLVLSWFIENYSLLVHDVIWSVRNISTFRRNVLSPCSGYKSLNNVGMSVPEYTASHPRSQRHSEKLRFCVIGSSFCQLAGWLIWYFLFGYLLSWLGGKFDTFFLATCLVGWVVDSILSFWLPA
jgi:hypothetical protein